MTEQVLRNVEPVTFPPAPVEAVSVYYVVPGHYSDGGAHATAAAAVREARATIHSFGGITGESRAFVDQRVLLEGGGSYPAARVEVFSDGTWTPVFPLPASEG